VARFQDIFQENGFDYKAPTRSFNRSWTFRVNRPLTLCARKRNLFNYVQNNETRINHEASWCESYSPVPSYSYFGAIRPCTYIVSF
jgi:hypothetical protein